MYNVDTLLKTKQCYTYAFKLDPQTYPVDSSSNTISFSPADDYRYDERALLQKTNIGRFGFGVDVKIGSNFTALTPTNYNYG